MIITIAGTASNGLEYPVRVTTSGNLVTDLAFSGTVNVGEVSFSQTPGENTVVVGSSALPTGAATQTTLAAILAKIIAAPATETTLNNCAQFLDNINSLITACNTGAVVVSSSALPADAATQTTLAALNTKVTACNTGAVVISSGTVTSNTATMTLSSSTAYETNRVVKASAGTLFNLSGYNSGPAQFIQLHNTTSLPADGQAPILLLAIPAQTTFSFDWTKGIPCSTGITVCNSTTGPTKTIGSANAYFTASFV